MCRYLAGEVIVIRYQHIAGCQSLYSYILRRGCHSRDVSRDFKFSLVTSKRFADLGEPFRMRPHVAMAAVPGRQRVPRDHPRPTLSQVLTRLSTRGELWQACDVMSRFCVHVGPAAARAAWRRRRDVG